MLQSIDLHTILISYARKLNSPVIEVDEFIHFLEKYVRRHISGRQEWKKWIGDVNTKVWAGIDALVKNGKCKLTDEKKAAKVLLLDFYSEMVDQIYKDIETLIELPFPDEKTLGISVPPEHISSLDIGPDMEEYMKNPQLSKMPLLKIVFPEHLGSALVLASYIPQRILSISLSKLAAFLETGHNMSFFYKRLSGQFTDTAGLLRNTMSQIKSGIESCLRQIETPGSFSYRFWISFCSQIQYAMKKKSEFTAPDISALQAAYIVEFFSNYYYKEAMRQKEKEAAIKEIESKIDKPPYMYTLKDIMAFTNSLDRPLKDYYDQKDLVDFLEKKTFFDKSAGPDAPLPSLLVFHNSLGDPIYINKTRVLLVVTKLITEAQPQIRQGISDHWTNSLREFCREPSMKDDKEFEKLVARYMDKLAPKLMVFLNDKKLFLVQDETIAAVPEEIRGSAVIYQTDGTMRPFPNLFNLNRKSLLIDVKINLPFWYSIPLFLAMGAFFTRKRKSKKKKNIPHKETPDIRPSGSAQRTKQAALDYQQQKLPPEKNLEQSLAELENEWRKVVSPEKKKQLVQDVRSQIRFRLKDILEVRKNMPITSASIDEMADGVIMVSPSFTELGNREKIHKYVTLYITSLLT
jgi:hypothetical protein